MMWEFFFHLMSSKTQWDTVDRMSHAHFVLWIFCRNLDILLPYQESEILHANLSDWLTH